MKLLTHIRAGVLDGSYLETCNEINENIIGNGYVELDAMCRQKNGVYASTSVVVPPYYYGEINNCDGDLVLGYCG